MIALKGPAYGILPKFTDIIIGLRAKRNLKEDQPLVWEDLYNVN